MNRDYEQDSSEQPANRLSTNIEIQFSQVTGLAFKEQLMAACCGNQFCSRMNRAPPENTVIPIGSGKLSHLFAAEFMTPHEKKLTQR
jgi:hypothetical protein